jgi:hypothetical protein
LENEKVFKLKNANLTLVRRTEKFSLSHFSSIPFREDTKAHLHHDKKRAKLLRFKEQKKYFAFLKHANLAGFLP